MADRRQELYDRIRQTSKDEVVLEEMIRLGFWPARGVVPTDPADEIRERAEIHRQLAALRTEQSRLSNIAALKQALFERRLAESKQKQAETKARRERERLARAEAWRQKTAEDIVYLGRGVSAGLSNRAANHERLRAQGLPVLETALEIASAAGIGVPELRFLSYARSTARITHYRRFQLAKKSGGTRLISAPLPRLKRMQRWLLEHVLVKVEAHDAAHGFRAGRSIVTNARGHVGARVVVNLDLEDFFPTVTLPRIRGVFRSLGYGELAATVFALIASEPDTTRVELDGAAYHVAEGPRRLPQGAPTSPAITNLLCRRLDRRLQLAARKLGFSYTRYADDLTFSEPSEPDSAGGAAHQDRVGQLLAQVRFIVAAEGFVVHEGKTRVLRRGRQQEVTGVVVNDRLGVDRATLRRFRAFLHALEKDGPAGKQWGEGHDVFASALGFANYVTMVDAEKGRALTAKVRAIAATHGWKPAPRKIAAAPVHSAPTSAGALVATPVSQAPAAPAAEAPAAEKKKWWKLF